MGREGKEKKEWGGLRSRTGFWSEATKITGLDCNQRVSVVQCMRLGVDGRCKCGISVFLSLSINLFINLSINIYVFRYFNIICITCVTTKNDLTVNFEHFLICEPHESLKRPTEYSQCQVIGLKIYTGNL